MNQCPEIYPMNYSMDHPLLSKRKIMAYITGKIGEIFNRNHRPGEDQPNGMERGESDGAAVLVEEEISQNLPDELVCQSLPDELIIEGILSRLPAQTLAVCCCVSKLWNDTILNDSRFSLIHNIQNKGKLSLVFNLLNVMIGGSERVYFFSFLGREKADIRVNFLSGFNSRNTHELVGFCNGLACTKLVSLPGDSFGSITVVNPIKGETLVLAFVPPTEGYIYLCHGFGFDPSSQAYKAVIVFTSEDYSKFLCMVITLGTMCWRKIITPAIDILPPRTSPCPMVTRVPRTLCRPATFCGGDLFWRTKNNLGIESLLSFDLHSEKIRFVGLPDECTPTTKRLAVDHLLEFKGYPCIARSEAITTRSSNDHCGHRCSWQNGASCCLYKLHMYVLKDKDKQAWTREETFDVQIMDLCRYFDTSAAAPPTRVLAFSDQVLLYWFNGERLVFHNLREKHLNVVDCFRSYPSIFQSRMNEDLRRRVADGDNIYCPSMDYQLHAQAENIVSLINFIPKEAKTIQADSADGLNPLLGNNPAAGWLTTGGRTRTFHAFF